MIIKIKTFSGETLYLPEEDYLDEVMYSDLEEREFANKQQALYKRAYQGLSKKDIPRMAEVRKEAAKRIRGLRQMAENSPYHYNPDEAIKTVQKTVDETRKRMVNTAHQGKYWKDENQRAVDSAQANLNLRNRATVLRAKRKPWKAFNIVKDAKKNEKAVRANLDKVNEAIDARHPDIIPLRVII